MTKREKQDTARMILVQMAKMARTPISVLADFIVAHDITGLNVAQTHGLTQATHDRIHESFRASAFLVEKRRKADATDAVTRFAVLSAPSTEQEAMRERAKRKRKKQNA